MIMLDGVKRRVALISATVALLTLAGSTASYADTPTDPTGGAGASFFTSVTSYLQNNLIAAVLGLAVIGVIVSMIIKWGKKAAKSS